MTLAERQAANDRSLNKRAQEMLYAPTPLTFGIVPMTVDLLNVVGVKVGHNNPKLLEDEIRKVRQTKQEGDSLTVQVNEAKEQNQKLAAHCTELLGEVDALNGKPRTTIDQRKDVLDQIKSQMSRMDYAGKQTDQAIKKNKELLASTKSSGAGHDKEMKDLQAQIESLQSEKTRLAEKNAKLAQMHKEISSR